jgi:ActR/RegA family two-component response regulator
MIPVVLADDQSLVCAGFRTLLNAEPVVADRTLAGVRVIVLTTFAEDAYIFEAIRSGASGWLIKDAEPAELVHALRVVHGGDALLSPTVTRRLIEEFAGLVRPGWAR